MNSPQPYWPDGCLHLERDGVFVGSTINGKDKVDVYLWWDKAGRGDSEVCIRYGVEGWEYLSPMGPVEHFIDPNHMVGDVDGKVVPYSTYHGPEIDLIRGYIEHNPDWKAVLQKRVYG